MPYRFYIDDSRFTFSKEENILWGGYIIHSSREDQFLKDVYSLKEKYSLHRFDPIKFSPDAEQGVYQKQRDIDHSQKKSLQEDVIKLISETELTIILACSNRKKKDEYKELINLLTGRFSMFVQNKCENEIGNIFLAYDDRIKSYNDYYIQLKKDGKVENTSTRGRVFAVSVDCLHESIYYVHERHSSLLQMSDFIISSVGQDMKKQKINWFSKLKNKIRHKEGEPSQIKGFGLLSSLNEFDWVCEQLTNIK